uniref:Bestrophin homolog n=1 Tax=Heterorhabditis bacteriophora TaxID=37862 RepID=A0A1I7WBF4_HETBA
MRRVITPVLYFSRFVRRKSIPSQNILDEGITLPNSVRTILLTYTFLLFLAILSRYYFETSYSIFKNTLKKRRRTY